MHKSSTPSKYHRYKEETYVFPHKHCPVCNKMIDEEEEYCSPECGGYYKKKDKGEKKKIYTFVMIYVVAIVVFIAIAFT